MIFCRDTIPWRTADDLCALFDVDPAGPGVDDWIDLVTLGLPLAAFPDEGYCLTDVVRGLLKTRKWSPMLFWSRMKRGLRPMLDASPDTWEALGVVVAPGFNALRLAEAVIIAQLTGHLVPATLVEAREIVAMLQEMKL